MESKIPFVDLTEQYHSIKAEIDRAVSDVLNRGWYILGTELTAFEDRFAGYCGVDFAAGVGSGTEALHLALLACGIRPGDEVITVPNTAVPTVSAICLANARPVLVDIDPDTYTMDPNRLEDYLKKRCKNNGSPSTGKPGAVIPVHLYGHPADMDPLLEIARKFDLKVIEDACQAHGAEYKNRKAGSMGDAGCFSFYPTKNLGACGDGGIVVTDNPDIAKKLRMLRNYGEEKKNYNVIEGFNSRLDEMQAAILSVKLRHLDRWNRVRRNYAGLYNNLLVDTATIPPIEKGHARHVFHLYVIRTDERRMLQQRLKNKGIPTSIHYPLPIHFQPAFKELGYQRGDLPVAEKYSEEILSLPMCPELKQDQIEFIGRTIKEYQDGQ